MSVDPIAVWLHISQMLALGTPPVAAPIPEQPMPLMDVGDDLVAENATLRAELARLECAV